MYYTFAKNMDNASNSILGEALSGSPLTVNAYDLHYDYGRSSYDIRHNLTGSLLYDLPYQKNRWIGGFQLSTILSTHSGIPYSALIGYDRSNLGSATMNERPDVVGNPDVGGPVAANPGCAAPASVHNAAHWFNPCAFALPAAGTLGDERRNRLNGPGLLGLAMGLRRTLSLTETVKTEIRAEAFNIINHTNFALPNLNVFSQSVATPLASAGTISVTAGSSRQLQFSVKLVF
jgi:hypothetical protein